MISLRLDRERARDADPLALAAGELVREAVEVLGVEPDALEQLARALASTSPPLARRAAAAASPTIWPTRLRGFSDACGSWKTICSSRRTGAQLAAAGRR